MRMLIIFALGIISFSSFAQSCLNFVPYNKKGLWGYADTAGNITIEPFSVNELGFFDDTDFVKYYSANGMEGLMDKNFKVKLPARFLNVEVIDKKLILAQVYKEAYKLYSIKGTLLSPLLFKYVSFSYTENPYLVALAPNGTAYVYQYDTKLDKLQYKRKHTQVNSVSVNNQEIYFIQYKHTPYQPKFYYLSSGALHKEDYEMEGRDYQSDIHEAPYSEGTYIRSKKTTYGKLPEGVQFQSSEFDDNSVNLMHIKVEGKWGVIDQENNILVPLKYDSIIRSFKYTPSSQAYYVPYKEHALGWICKKDSLYGVISNNDSFNVPFEYTRLSYFAGYLKARKNGKYGLLSYDAKVAIPFEIDSFYNQHPITNWSYISNGIFLFAINKDNRLAMYCTNGQKTGYDFTSFDYMRNNWGGYSGVKLYDGKLYGAVMFMPYGIAYYPCTFKNIYFARIHCSEDYFKVQRTNKQFGYINKTGRKFYED